MTKSILNYLKKIYEPNFPDKKLEEAFTQEKNRSLAEIGDSVLDLIIRIHEYEKPGATPESIDDARQSLANNRKLQDILNQDYEFTKFLIIEYGCTSPAGNIGLKRSDAFMEAIIGAVYLSKGIEEAHDFVNYFLELEL